MIQADHTITLGPNDLGVTRVTIKGVPLCPDLLEYRDLGMADNFRGRVVRAFFWLLRWGLPV